MLDYKDTFCLCNSIKILSTFLMSYFKLKFVDDFTKIVPSVFGPYICHHQGLFACVKRFLKNKFID